MNIVPFLTEYKMNFIGARYYKINKLLLCILGLWPYQITKRIQIQPILFYSIYISFLFAELCSFFILKCDLIVVLKILSHLFPTILELMEYNSFYTNAKNIKLLLDKIQNDWNALDDKKEIEIIEKYTYRMHIFTSIVTLLSCITIIIFYFIELWPIILDNVLPLNKSRPRNTFVLTEYFVDREKYFIPIMLHEMMLVTTGLFTIIATGTTLMAYTQHSCGMLKIVSFRIAHLLDKNISQRSSLQIDRIICNKIAHAVDLHRKIANFLDTLVSTFVVQFTILTFIGVVSMSINLYRFLLPSTLQSETELLASITLIVVHYFYMFMANYVGQLIIDHSEDVFRTTCNVLWYVVPKSSQKMLLFLMHRTMKNLKICGGFNAITASYEAFATLSTTSLSYFTVLYSLQ
ncbi:uncharacterized protein LOC120359057 [Solenopsis invicta]|uniref:uncharacterized protein LOC120359057 n=1 Tax=Solenopsis invicta TaxID=13686 RepID=UPI00193D5BB1|nr:uncharacterized protein LOC120359057 [Solenopsis invicta]